MNITAELAREAMVLANEFKTEIADLETLGPRGGSNAMNIPGWDPTGNQTITKACHAAGIETLPYWPGRAPTPSRAIPQCIAYKLRAKYDQLVAAR